MDNESENKGKEEYEERHTLPKILDGRFFKIIINESEKINRSQITAACQLCLPANKVYKGSAGATSNFVTHLKRMHPDHYSIFLTHKSEAGFRRRKLTLHSSEFSRPQKCMSNYYENMNYIPQRNLTKEEEVTGNKASSDVKFATPHGSTCNNADSVDPLNQNGSEKVFARLGKNSPVSLNESDEFEEVSSPLHIEVEDEQPYRSLPAVDRVSDSIRKKNRALDDLAYEISIKKLKLVQRKLDNEEIERRHKIEKHSGEMKVLKLQEYNLEMDLQIKKRQLLQ